MLLDWNAKSKYRKKIYNVSVEALQNLFHHSNKAPKEVYEGNKFAIYILEQKAEDVFEITTGNFINIEQKYKLKNRFDQINYLSLDKIKELYKLILSNSEFSFKGGGGLGMIDIARKTKHKLTYKFYNYSKEIIFFEFNVVIS